MAAPNLSEIVTTTLRNRSRMVADMVSNNNALLTRLRTRGKSKPFSGGREIVHELAYQETQTVKHYSGYDVLDVQPSPVLSAAVYAIKQLAVSVTMSGLEELQNAGRQQVIDLLDARLEVAEDTMKNTLSEDIYSDGTSYNGKQVNGLQALIPTSTDTGTAGGISRASWEFWRNQAIRDGVNGVSLKLSNTGDSDQLLPQMRRMWVRLCRGSEKPDLIIADNETYTHFWGELAEKQRFSGKGDMARAGFETLKFNTSDIVLDGGIGGEMPARRMYFINSKYLMWRPHSKRDMVPMEARESYNQDAMVKFILWAGNMTMNGAKFQGVLQAAA